MNDANNAVTLALCPFCGTYSNPNDPSCATLEQAYARTEVRPFGCPYFTDSDRKMYPLFTQREAIALARMVFKAVQFADRAAGEGIFLDDLDPSIILSDCATAIGTDTWDRLPEVARDAILAARLDEAAIRKDEREPTSEMLLAGARSIGNSMGADNFMVRAKSCWDAMQAARMGTMEPRPAIRNGGKQP